MTAKSILNIFEDYRRSRIQFVQTVADLALRPQNYTTLRSANVIELLRPLLEDICPQVQQCACVALGRLAHQDPAAGAEMVQGNMLKSLLSNLESRNKYYRRSAMFVLRAVCKYDAEIASEALLTSGGMDALLMCLSGFDVEEKEAAAWAVGYAARHGHNLSRAIVDAGCVPHLALCLQEPEVSLRRVAASAIADIARHDSELAQAVADSGCIPQLARSIGSRDLKLQRQALIALSSIARHSQFLAELVVQTDIVGTVLIAMGNSCSLVRRNAAMLIRDICRHTIELGQLVANAGGLGVLLETANDPDIGVRIPAITALGFIAGHERQLACCIITCDGVATLAKQLCDEKNENEYELLCVTVWAIGQLARHSPQNVAEYPGLLTRLLQMIINTKNDTSEEKMLSDSRTSFSGPLSTNEPPFIGSGPNTELRNRCRNALRQCVQGCTTLSALEPLLNSDCPTNILKYVLAQFAKLLPSDPRARRLFVTSGGLKKVQEIQTEPGTSIMEYITIINACFPDEIVRYYTPGYPDSLLEKVEQFVPQFEQPFPETNSIVQQPCSNLPSAPVPSQTNSIELMGE